jgi:hypothetical protein
MTALSLLPAERHKARPVLMVSTRHPAPAVGDDSELRPISLKALVSVLALLAAIHAGVIVPSILWQAGKEVDIKIDAHASRAHDGVVQLERYKTDIQRIEFKLDELVRLVTQGRK